MCEESSIFRFLCPSLLSEQEILEELRNRCVKIKGLEKKSREELTRIFSRHFIPLPQRTFPNNHHGKLINKMIERENFQSRKSKKLEERGSSLQFGFGDNKKGSKLSLPSKTESTTSVAEDRLKPPIESIDLHNKKISLSKTPSCTAASSLDKIIINNRSRERKESSGSESERRRSSSETVEIKKPELKRTHSTSENSDDGSPVKKARQKIAWP